MNIRNDFKKLCDILYIIFKTILTKFGYKVRKNQVELAEHILSTFYNRHISISEAGVGTGKTHAYIIAAILQKQNGKNDDWIRGMYALSRDFRVDTPMPVVISTSSIALQTAIIKDYIPQISKILLEHKIINKPISAVIRKGKEHYICDARLKEYISAVDTHKAKAVQPLNDLGYLKLDLDEVSGLTPYIKRKINVTRNCSAQCPCYKTCRYLQFQEYVQSSKHDFQVCNHNFLLADILKRKKNQRPLIPNYQAIIFDEAHKLTQAAQMMYGNVFSNQTLPRIISRLEPAPFKDKNIQEKTARYYSKLSEYNTLLFNRLLKNIPPKDDYSDDTERFKTCIDTTTARYIKHTIYYAGELLTTVNDNPGINTRRENVVSHILWELQKAYETLQIFQQPEDMIYWLEIPKATKKVTHEIILSSIPKKMDKMFFNDVWNNPFPIILTSGTLSVSGCFSHIKKSLGLGMVRNERLSEMSKPSPFDYKENCLLYISETIPFPDNKSPAYINAISAEIEKLIIATHGHTAVLFTSYRMMEIVFETVKQRVSGFPFIKLDRGYINPIEQFRKSKNGVLFASGSLWEGIDLPGDILSSLIIVKLPFAVPDPISEYEQTQYKSIDEYKRIVVFPEMIIKLKQGYGRLIRKESDTGIVAILDPRVKRNGHYRQRVLEALPISSVTSSIDDVERFIKDKKNVHYFKAD